jgi:CRISPR type III-A-associated RAMP protein Csm5
MQKVLQARRLEELFLHKIKSPSFKLKDFLSQNDIAIDEVKATGLEIKGQIAGSISRHISSNGRVFIPGSSLKGAFRTALAWNYLKDRGEEKLRRAVMNLERCDKPKEAVKQMSLESFVFAESHSDPLRNLQISDTSFLPPGETQVYALSRFNITGGQTRGIPTPKEVIPPRKALQLKMNCKGVLLKEEGFQFLGEEEGIYTLFQLANAFCREIALRERGSSTNSHRWHNFIASLSKISKSWMEKAAS